MHTQAVYEEVSGENSNNPIFYNHKPDVISFIVGEGKKVQIFPSVLYMNLFAKQQTGCAEIKNQELSLTFTIGRTTLNASIDIFQRAQDMSKIKSHEIINIFQGNLLLATVTNRISILFTALATMMQPSETNCIEVKVTLVGQQLSINLQQVGQYLNKTPQETMEILIKKMDTLTKLNENVTKEEIEKCVIATDEPQKDTNDLSNTKTSLQNANQESFSNGWWCTIL